MLPMFLAIVDQTIVAAALPAIAGDLGSVERVSWVVIAYLVATTISAPVYGRLGDHLGRRSMMLVALTIMVCASILCGLARNIETLTAARVLQGFGGGGLLTLSQALIGEVLPPRDRARYQGILATVGVGSSAFGAVIGGLLTEYLGWRSVFFVGVPIGLLAIVMVRRLPIRPRSDQPFRFDFAGLALFAVFIASSLVMLHNLQTLDASVVLPAVLLLATSAVACALLVWREKRASSPLLPISLLRRPAIWRSDALATCHGAVLVSLLTFLPIYLRVVHGAAADKIGLFLFPVAGGVSLGSMTTGWLVGRTGRTAIFPSVGLAVVAINLIALAVWASRLDLIPLAALLTITAVFMGTTMGVVQVTVQTATGPAMLGTGAASVQFCRSLGAALGTAIVGAVLFSSLALADPDAAHQFGRIVQSGPEILSSLPEARQVAIAAEIANAFRAAFFTMATIATIAMGLAWSLPIRRI
jgi:EmrB/QacA subfamily drug resistance transporter